MARVLGIGGFFFYCKDVGSTRDGYSRVLDVTIKENGGPCCPIATRLSTSATGH